MIENGALLKELANHVQLEEYAARAYRQAAYWADDEGYDGTAAFCLGEANEETEHSVDFAKYVLVRGGSVLLGRLDAFDLSDLPQTLLVCYQELLTVERDVVENLQRLSAMAVAAGDFDAVRFLQKYLEIGTRSIYDLTTWTQQLGRLRSEANGLWLFDRERGAGATG